MVAIIIKRYCDYISDVQNCMCGECTLVDLTAYMNMKDIVIPHTIKNEKEFALKMEKHLKNKYRTVTDYYTIGNSNPRAKKKFIYIIFHDIVSYMMHRLKEEGFKFKLYEEK